MTDLKHVVEIKPACNQTIKGQKRSICKLCAVAHEASLKQAGWIFRYE